MHSFTSTATISRSAERIDSGAAFFARFPSAWDALKTRVLKLETRQEYREPGNPSWEILQEDGLSAALAVLPEARSVDAQLYADLARRGVQFVRCRPFVLPLSTYLQWELGCYDFNSQHGELIYLVERAKAAALFDELALHDFMVFDQSLAFIHDYDPDGQIIGGWQVEDPADISHLRGLYEAIWQRCEPYQIVARALVR